MFRPLRNCLAPLAAVTLAFAGGGNFQPTVLDSGNAGLLASPHIAFRQILDDLLLPPAEFKAVPAPEKRWRSADYPAHTAAAELDDLRAAGASDEVIARHAQRRASALDPLDPPPPASLHDLPVEFATYFKGVRALQKPDLPAARKAFEAVLALPPDKRRHKTVWAAYMLGKLAARSGDREEAAAWFVRTRDFAREGFVDSTGLAAASLGEEARLAYDQKEWLAACELYLRQYATGDTTALNSLRFTAARATSEPKPEVLAQFARHPGPRAVITARLMERFWTFDRGYYEPYHPQTYDDESPEPGKLVRRWLTALEAENITDAREATLFALAAYKAGAFTDCARWLKLAPADEPGPDWLRAKLALRDGRIDDATALLAATVQKSAAPFGYGRNTSQLSGELAQLRLAHRDYAEALRLLLRGGYWIDAAYIAERVFSIEELTAFVAVEKNLGEDEARLKHLLARRLVRADRASEAAVYFPPNYAETLADFTAHLKAGADLSRPAVARGLSLFRAAEILRWSGMELRGAELEPDQTYWGGSYSGVTTVLDSRSKAGGFAAPSDDEIARAIVPAATPNRRFHYRYLAADLAWEAAQLLPDNSTELVKVLMEAGGWIKARDPQAADRFYKALVNRCPDTDLGREAKRIRWFPKP